MPKASLAPLYYIIIIIIFREQIGYPNLFSQSFHCLLVRSSISIELLKAFILI